MSEETKVKMGIAQANRTRKPHSTETRKKISSANKGKAAWKKGLTKLDPRVAKSANAKIGKPRLDMLGGNNPAKRLSSRIKIRESKFARSEVKSIRHCIDCGKPRPSKTNKYALHCKECGQKGERGSGWKGGMTPINKIIRASSKYKKWRIAIFERDDYTCVSCKQRGGKLNADHIKPFSLFPELRFEPSNGRTLCFDCHKKQTHTVLGRRKRNFFSVDNFIHTNRGSFRRI